jgi:hypothetical protein
LAAGAATRACARARREGNQWSHQYCRRQWSLADADHLRYRQLNAWDAALQRLDAAHGFLGAAHQIVSHAGEDEQARPRPCPRPCPAAPDGRARLCAVPGGRRRAGSDAAPSARRRLSGRPACKYLQAHQCHASSSAVCLCVRRSGYSLPVDPTLPLCCRAQLLVAERGPLVFVFNFSPFHDYADYKARRRPRRAPPCRRCGVAAAAPRPPPAQAAPPGCSDRGVACVLTAWTRSATQAKRRSGAGLCARDRSVLWCARQVGTPEPGKYRIALDSDDPQFGGPARIGHGAEHFTHPEGQPGARGLRSALPGPAQRTQTCRAGQARQRVQACARWRRAPGNASMSSACRALGAVLAAQAHAHTNLPCETHTLLASAGVPENNFIGWE